MSQRLLTYLSVAVAVAICCFIFHMSAKPAVESTELSMGVVYRIVTYVIPGYEQMNLSQQLYWQDALETPIRKLAHFTEFALLAVSLLNAVFQAAKLRRGEAQLTVKLVGVSWVLSALYAASDEFHQLFVPERAGMIADVCIDAAGAAFGLFVAWGICRIWRRCQQRALR